MKWKLYDDGVTKKRDKGLEKADMATDQNRVHKIPNVNDARPTKVYVARCSVKLNSCRLPKLSHAMALTERPASNRVRDPSDFVSSLSYVCLQNVNAQRRGFLLSPNGSPPVAPKEAQPSKLDDRDS